MPSSTLSSIPFRRRDPGINIQAPSFNNIIFPKIYEEAWGSCDDKSSDDRSDFDRARIFLLRMTNMTPDPKIIVELRTIVAYPQNRTIQALATAIQHRIFGDSHGSFATTPLMQSVRFMLLKSRVPELILSNRTRSVVDFFFDPTLERNLNPAPTGDVSIYKYPAGRLKVAIIGGGPTALASAIALAEKGAGSVEVHIDQVVTLQDSVTRLLSKASFQALFADRPERVWPGSANIQIRKVEDRFLKRVQDPEFQSLIYLHCEGVTREDLANVGEFHVLLGADGAASWVRQSSYALGLAFDRPAGLPWSQPLNIFLTLGQTRYLLNAKEWHKMLLVDGQPVHFGRPGCFRNLDGSIPEGFEPSQVFAPSEDSGGPLWVSTSDGLKLFGFKEEDVINVLRIPIMLPPQDSINVKRPRALVAVAGDAVMTVHFWPGRGLNSGIKAGLSLGDELVHALNNGKFIGMPIDAMKAYNDFILKLQGREHDKRSIPILNQSSSPEMLSWLLQNANSVPDHVAIEWLIGAMTQLAERLQRRDDWSYAFLDNVEAQLQMAVSFPWPKPTREMASAEVLPIRSMKPEEKQKWLNNLWGILRDERNRDRSPSVARFEAPKGVKARPVSLMRPNSNGLDKGVGSASLRRSNATQSVRHSRNPSVPGKVPTRTRPPSPGGEVSLSRMLTVHQKPSTSVLGDALSLALFRVEDQ
ncbi:hypothetical protein V8C37DRAFT_414235 [Trichoderma ceciliae]